jgi:hypothetical protein
LARHATHAATGTESHPPPTFQPTTSRRFADRRIAVLSLPATLPGVLAICGPGTMARSTRRRTWSGCARSSGSVSRRDGSIGFETTLASRSFAPWFRRLRASGYEIHLLFLWLPSADFALDRVAERVRAGGHAAAILPDPRSFRARGHWHDACLSTLTGC